MIADYDAQVMGCQIDREPIPAELAEPVLGPLSADERYELTSLMDRVRDRAYVRGDQAAYDEARAVLADVFGRRGSSG